MYSNLSDPNLSLFVLFWTARGCIFSLFSTRLEFIFEMENVKCVDKNLAGYYYHLWILCFLNFLVVVFN